MGLSLINRLLVTSIRQGRPAEIDGGHGVYLFESARSAIYNFLTAQGVGEGDEVIISSFTCDAVTYAVARTGAQVVYVDVNDDLTMNDSAVLDAVSARTKAVVMQNTFGRLGLQLSTIEHLRAQSLTVIEDCALAIGSTLAGRELGSFGDAAVWSLEVSKTVTLGWGGVLSLNGNKQMNDAIQERLDQIGRVSVLGDIRRVFQLWFSALMGAAKLPGAVVIWYFMYGFRIFRKSNYFELNRSDKHERMGPFTQALFHALRPNLSNAFRKTSSNYRRLLAEAKSSGLRVVVAERAGAVGSVCVDEVIVTPRISFVLDELKLEQVAEYADSVGVELGRWFSDAPPPWNLQEAKIHSCANARRIAQRIVNLPCHWTLSDTEIESLVGVIHYISELE
ncbi:DegT/DnrJ/EryC1/StrS family aminotransferase [Litorivivens sp.]|uniref:DegT/DnrJ/EryC1/StrS family aminotransferase n=1 Tax=Litorivivens sp. TaxID=2020868 RepID=UPI0035616CDC